MIRFDRSWLAMIVVSALLIIVMAVTWEPLPAHFNEPAKPGQRIPAPPQSVHIDDLLAIRGFLLGNDWPRLDSALAFNHDSARRDVHYETHYRALMDAVDVSDPALRPHVDAWVDHEPSSAVAHIARATYFNRVAQAARGAAYASETSDEQRQGMREWQELSRRDAETAKTLDADNVLVYWLELGFAFSDAEVDQTALLKEGLAHSPGSLLLPVRRVLLLTPRWGGSVGEMEQYARRAQGARDINPRLATIQGFVNYDAARELREAKQDDEAVAELTKALEYGEHFEFRNDRATSLYNQGKYEAALDDLDHALAERPGYLEALSLRSVVYEKLAANATGARQAELLGHANADALNAVALDSTDKNVKWAMKRH
jgi:tetratricopeptide (TPR) repeat protein